MDFLKILRAFLLSAYKLTESEVDSLLNSQGATEDTTLAALLEKDKNRIQPLTGKFQEGVNKGTKDAMEKVEKAIRAKFGIEDETLQGQDLIDHVATLQTAAAGASGKKPDLTDDDVKRHPVYIAAEKAFKKTLAEKDTEMTKKIQELEGQHNKAQTFQTISGKIEDILNGLNPVFPANPSVAKTWKTKFLNEFKDFDFDVKEDGTIIVMKDGKVLHDGHGHNMEFEDLVKSTAGNYFEFKVNNGGGNSGNGKEGGTGGTGGNQSKTYPAGVTKPKTFEEVEKLMADPAIKLEDRTTILETWEAEQKAG